MNKNVLFLDFDGTMIPTTFSAFYEQLNRLNRDIPTGDGYGEFFAPHCVAGLQRIVRAQYVDIVVTSKWKMDMNLERLQQMWRHRQYPGIIVGVTPNLPGSRGDEIKAWLDEHPVDGYAILDDMGPSMFLPEQLGRLVVCEDHLGLTMVEAQRVLERL